MSEIAEVPRILAKDGGQLKQMDCAALSLPHTIMASDDR